MKKQLFTLLTLLVMCVTGAWADATTATIDFENGALSDIFAVTSDASITNAISNYPVTIGEEISKPSDNNEKILLVTFGSTKNVSTKFVTKSSYSSISNISIKLATSDKGKTFLTIETCPNADFSSDVTTVQANSTFNDAGITSNKKLINYSKNIATPASGYVRITIDQGGNQNKVVGIDDIVITYSDGTSGKTSLTGAWSNAAPSFTVGSSAAIPTFSVTGGGTLGTDYTVAYTKTDASSIVTLTDGTGAISGISTAAAATATVTATVTIVNTEKYEMATTSYDCAISVIDATPYSAPTITEKNGTVQISSADEGVAVSQIKYSLDNGKTWNTYSIPFNLEEATTVKAKVTTGNDKSKTDSDVTSEECNAIPAAAPGSSSITLYKNNDWTESASQDGSSTNDTWTGKASTDFEGYIIALDNEGKTGGDIKALSTGNAINNNTTIKGSNGRTLTFTLPTGVKVNRITIYSYTNGDDNNHYSSGWKLNGTAADMIGLSLRDVEGNSGKSVSSSSSPDVRVFAFDTPLEESFTFTNTGYQQCFYMVLDYTVSVTIASSGYSSLGSAYGLDFANATTSTENAAKLTAFAATESSETSVKLVSIDEAPARTGVILKGTPGATYTIPVKADAATLTVTNLLHAAVTATPILASTSYIMQGGKFHLVTEASDVPAGKAYLVPGTSPARELTFFFDGETTGINVATEKNNTTTGVYYNLAGQRVNQPAKGIYVVDGKKVIK